MIVLVGRVSDEPGRRMAKARPFHWRGAVAVEVGTAGRVAPRPLVVRIEDSAVTVEETSGCVLQLQNSGSRRGTKCGYSCIET